LQSLILARIETFLITIAWLAVPQNKTEIHNEEQLRKDIEWLIEIYFERRLLKFREAVSYVKSAID
jgi:hypothetical protein